MTKQEIITVMKAALELLKIEDALPEDFNTDAQSDIVSAQSALIVDLFADVETCRTVLDALRTTAPAVDQAQLRELIEENGRLKRELEATRTEKNAITMTANKRLDELTHLQRDVEQLKTQLRAKEDELQHYKKQTLAAYAAVDDVPEDSSTEGEIDAEEAPAAPAKKARKATPRHTWTTEEDAWIANHLNSARSREVIASDDRLAELGLCNIGFLYADFVKTATGGRIVNGDCERVTPKWRALP